MRQDLSSGAAGGAWHRLDHALDRWLCGPIPEASAQYHDAQFARQLPLLRALVVFALASFVAFWWWDGVVQGDAAASAQRLRLQLAVPLAILAVGIFIGRLSTQRGAYRAFVGMLMLGVCAVTSFSHAGLTWALSAYMAVPLVTAPFFTRWFELAYLLALLALVPGLGLYQGEPGPTVAFNYAFYMGVAVIGTVILFLVVERTRRRARALELQLQLLANHDALTGLLSRRRFMQLAQRRMRRAPDGPHALAYLDIDHFKAINDDFGHDAGDMALAAVGEVLSRLSGADGLAGRLGGEEFAVLLSGRHVDTDASCALLLDGVRDIQVHGRALTTSIGHACQLPGESLDALLTRADHALLQAKRQGRDRCQRA